MMKIHVNLNRINNGNFWDVPPKDSNDNHEEDGSFEENLEDDKFVHNMSSEVRRYEHYMILTKMSMYQHKIKRTQ